MVIIIVVYLDSLLVVSAKKRDEERALRNFHYYFPIKDLEGPSRYLGGRITRDRDAGTLKLGQFEYVKAMVERFRIATTSAIPSVAGGIIALSRADGPQT